MGSYYERQLEAKIGRQKEEITRLLAENAELKGLNSTICDVRKNDEFLKKTAEQARAEGQQEAWKLAHYEDLEEAGRLIELPCKIGDTVYGIRRYRDIRIVQSGIVSEMYFSQENRLIIVINHICRGYWGENIFGSFEEAKAALKECEAE